LIKNQGVDTWHLVYERRQSLAEFEKTKKEKSTKMDVDDLLKFLSVEFEGRLAFDELKCQVTLDGQVLALTDELRCWLCEKYKIKTTKEALNDALTYQARKSSFHPVRKYLETVERTVKPININDLSARYFGTEDVLYDIFLKRWLIGAVARVFEPGCKLDTALILQGDQGIGKSSFFSTLGGQWFDDSLQDLSSKDAFLILHKCWIQELGEFERISSKRAAGEIKAFLSRQSDCFRKPYAREAIEYPRTSVLCGSVNKLSFLLDETGNRRFWIIPVGEECEAIDLDLLAQERDAIWAAAVQAYRHGEQWWLTSQEQYLSSQNNERFELVDEWQVEVEHYLDSRDEVSVGEILFNQLNIEPAHQDKPSQMRVAAILTKLGWYKKGRKKHLGKKQIVWSRKKEIVKVGSNGVKGVSGAPNPYSTRDTEGHTRDIPSFQEVCLLQNELTGQKIIQDTPNTPFSLLLGKNKKREKGAWVDKPRYVPPDASFQPNERVIYEQTVYSVRNSTHTHVWLEGIEKAIAIWEVEKIDESK
jgi:predicted P-loop ATPase